MRLRRFVLDRNKENNGVVIDILSKAYEELRYSFYNCGYPNAGSFLHVCSYGHFMLTKEEVCIINTENWSRV